MEHQTEKSSPSSGLESLPPLVWLALIYLSAFVGWGLTAIAFIGITRPPSMNANLALLGLSVIASFCLAVVLPTDPPFSSKTKTALKLTVLVYGIALVSSTVTAAAFNTLTDPFIDHAVLILTLGLLPALNTAAASAHCLYKWAKQHHPGWFRLEHNTDLQTPDLASEKHLKTPAKT